MIRRLFMTAMCVVAFAAVNCSSTTHAQQGSNGQAAVAQTPMAMAQAPAYGAHWGQQGPRNMNRFYHYPYVTYPQNYWGNDYYRSVDSLYYRYPAAMRIPVYNKDWYNYPPTSRRYHFGHHFILDVF